MKTARVLICLILLQPAACSHGLLSTTQSITPVESNPQGFAAWTDASPAYRFNAGDKLRVQFLLTPEMTEDVTVGPDGGIALQAAGQVRAAGMTAGQLRDAITTASERMLTHPIVTVSLVDAAGARVFIGGSVSKPGAYPIDVRRGALEAIVLAGGFDRESRADEVVLIRRNPDDKPMLRTIDLAGFISTGTASGDAPLYPGDIVYVPRNRISEIDLWVEQFVTKLMPFNRNFDYALQRNVILP